MTVEPIEVGDGEGQVGDSLRLFDEPLVARRSAQIRQSFDAGKIARGEAVGVSATPTMFINGQRLEGAVDVQEVKAALNQQLLAAGVQPPPNPTPKKDQPASK